MVKVEKQKQFLYQPSMQGSQAGSVHQRENPLRPSLGTINVIFEASGRIGTYSSEIMSVSSSHSKDPFLEPKRGKMQAWPALSFFDKDKVGTYQPHDNALVVTLQIGGYDVRRALEDHGSGAKIMYPNLYKGLKLKPENLVSYDSPPVGFDGKIVVPRGMIKLLA